MKISGRTGTAATETAKNDPISATGAYHGGQGGRAAAGSSGGSGSRPRRLNGAPR